MARGGRRSTRAVLLQPQPQSQPPADADAEPDLVESAGGDATLDDPTHALRPATSAAAPEALAGGRGAGNGHAAGNGMAKLGFLRSLSRRSDPPAGVVSRGAGLEGLAAAIQAAGKVVVGGAPRAQGSKGTKAGGAENDAAARGNADGRAAALHRRATHDPPEQVEQHHSLPMDWTLKRRVAFKSSAPFECFESTFASRPTSAHEVLRCFTSGNRRSRDPGSMYQQALLSWQFPIDPAPPQSGVQPGIRNDGIPSPRAALWRESLRDLVYAVESAGPKHAGFFGALVQATGVGSLLASLVRAILQAALATLLKTQADRAAITTEVAQRLAGKAA